MTGVQWLGAGLTVGAVLWLTLDKAARVIADARFNTHVDEALAVQDGPAVLLHLTDELAQRRAHR